MSSYKSWHKYVMFFCLILTVKVIFSQNYTVGIPVNDSITTIFYSSNIDCQPNSDLALSLPYSNVTGVESIFIINSSAPVTSVPGGLLNTIDTLYPLQFSNNYEIYIPYGETFRGTIKMVGVPEIAGEQYGCNTFGWNSIGTICPTVYSFYWVNNCFVSAITSLHNYDNLSFIFYPNPTKDKIILDLEVLNLKLSTIRIYDGIGNELLQSQIFNSQFTIDITNYPQGVYIIQIETPQGLVSKKFIKQK